MAKAFLSSLVAGLVGGIIGAYILVHLDSRASLSRAPFPARSGEVISARRIQLVDAGGKVRAELAMALDGGPSLFFFGATASFPSFSPHSRRKASVHHSSISQLI